MGFIVLIYIKRSYARWLIAPIPFAWGLIKGTSPAVGPGRETSARALALAPAGALAASRAGPRMLHLMRLWPGVGWMSRVIAFHGIGVRFRRVQKDIDGTIAIEVHGQSFVNVKKGEAVRRLRSGPECLPKKTCRSCLA